MVQLAMAMHGLALLSEFFASISACRSRAHRSQNCPGATKNPELWNRPASSVTHTTHRRNSR